MRLPNSARRTSATRRARRDSSHGSAHAPLRGAGPEGDRPCCAGSALPPGRLHCSPRPRGRRHRRRRGDSIGARPWRQAMSTFDDVQSPADEERRKLLARATAAGGLALAGASLPFVASLAPSERARAQGAPIEVDTAMLKPGELKTVKWRGKPVWILARTPAM